eukprot:Seg1152.2 transcript_id=Seg1152.2/GoldUCD/mRNA.D3Y31 product="72 kDa type IV collagenase" protein_id=Seg1152.2/GoldUCD/D3Y31
MDTWWNIVLLVSCAYIVEFAAAKEEEVVIGRLIAVDNPNVKRSPKEKDRNQVFATRVLSFLKKDGDLFKIHRPGLLGGDKSVSFESVRLPGFFLRQKNFKLRLDNLKSRYIKKDATFLESKDPVGETFRLFVHDNTFLCHEPKKGMNLVMVKDSPKRDTLSCAFNIKLAEKPAPKAKINPPKKTKAAAPSPKPKAQVGTFIKNKTTGEEIPEFKDLVDAIKQNKDPFPQQPGGGLVVLSGPAAAAAAAKAAKQAKAKKPPVVDAKTAGAKARAKAAAAQAKKKVPKPAGPKPGLKQNKPNAKPVKPNMKANKPNLQQNKAKVQLNKAKDQANIKPKLPNIKAKPANSKVVQKPKVIQTPKKPAILKAKPGNFAKANPKAMLPVAPHSPMGGFMFGPNYNQQRMFGPPMPSPVHEDQSFFKPLTNQWFVGSPTKKVMIANPNFVYWQARQANARRQFALKRSQYAQQLKLANYAKLHPQPIQQANAASRQTISNLFPEPVHFNSGSVPEPVHFDGGSVPEPVFDGGSVPEPVHFHNGPAPDPVHVHSASLADQKGHYVPPSQWDQVMNGHGPDIKRPPLHKMLTHGNKVVPGSHPTPTTYSYETDTLLTKLHPELALLHNAHHDINEVTTSDPNMHHIDLLHNRHPAHPTTVQISALSHETATQTGLNTAVIDEQIAGVQHITLPSQDPFHTNTQINSVHINHTPQLVITNPNPSIITSNLAAENSLVHSDPDITLKEAFDKLTPMHSHPVEVTSEPIDIGHETDKAFHMRTHYVSGKPVDMDDGEDKDSMREVHVVHHNHHLVHAANEDERQKFISTLVDAMNDLCISLVFVNQLGDRYRLVSTINPHGYRPKGNRFSLKTIFKEPKKRKVMSFKAYDEEDTHRPVLLNGHRELNVYPTSCANDPVQVIVDSAVSKIGLVTGSKKQIIAGIPPFVPGRKRHTGRCLHAIGGTSTPGACCVFPFKFKGRLQNSCLPFGGDKKRRWCSLSHDFDRERRWGMCSIPDLTGLNPDPPQSSNPLCPPSCTSACGSECPMSCCSDASSSLLH